MMTAMMMGGATYGLRRSTSVLSAPPPNHRDDLHTIANRDQTASPFEAMSDQQGSPTSPTHNDSPGANITPQSPPNMRGVPKECGVCGDVAKSMHFGGLSCDSCKAFFRRSVQNNAYKGFSCPYEKNCFIGVSSRKACQFCRFQKCVSIGMEKSWVMTEDERRRMMQQRQERKKAQEDSIATRPTSAEHEDSYSLSEEDRSEIFLIVSLYKKAYNEIPYDDQNSSSLNMQGGSSVLAPWMTFCKRIAYFFTLFKDFADLDSSDQVLLLKTAITSAGIIMGSVVYDSQNGRWASKNFTKPSHEPNVTFKNVEKLVPSDLFSRVDKFFRKFQSICPDETMGIILILITLYSPELMGLQARETVQSLQERYIRILHHYVKFKFKERSAVMFPKAIVSLADIRELADRTWQMQINEKCHSNFTGLVKGGTPLNHGAPKSVNTCAKLENNSFGPLSSEAAKRARLAATGDARDFIYQKIIEKVLDHMHTSAKHIRAPSLLPFIVQIVKKLSKQHQEKNEEKSITYNGSSGSRRSSHRYHQRTHRLGHKRRLVEIKQEKNTSLYPAPDPFTEPMEDIIIKTEVMDTDSNDDYLLASSSNDSSSANSFTVPYSTVEGYLVQPSPPSSSISHYTANPSQQMSNPFSIRSSPPEASSSQSFEMLGFNRVSIQNIAQDPTNPSVTLQHQQQQQQQQQQHYSKPTFQQAEYQQLQSQQCGQEFTELLPVGSSYRHEAASASDFSSGALAPSPYTASSLSAGTSYTIVSQSEPISISSPSISSSSSKNIPMQMISHSSQISPISQFSSPSSSLTPPINTNLQPYVLHQQQQSPDPVHSPYSSASSSSSPEDYSQNLSTDVISSDFAETEVDALSQLLECLNNADGVNNIKELLPAPVWKELEKLVCFSENSSSPADAQFDWTADQ